jgi:hypothetical protein
MDGLANFIAGVSRPLSGDLAGEPESGRE